MCGAARILDAWRVKYLVSQAQPGCTAVTVATAQEQRNRRLQMDSRRVAIGAPRWRTAAGRHRFLMEMAL